MSWRDYKHNIVAVRKEIWDELWHVVYINVMRETYDRVDKKTALMVERNMGR